MIFRILLLFVLLTFTSCYTAVFYAPMPHHEIKAQEEKQMSISLTQGFGGLLLHSGLDVGYRFNKRWYMGGQYQFTHSYSIGNASSSLSQVHLLPGYILPINDKLNAVFLGIVNYGSSFGREEENLTTLRSQIFGGGAQAALQWIPAKWVSMTFSTRYQYMDHFNVKGDLIYEEFDYASYLRNDWKTNHFLDGEFALNFTVLKHIIYTIKMQSPSVLTTNAVGAIDNYGAIFTGIGGKFIID